MTRLATGIWLLFALIMLASFALLLVAPPDPPNRPRHGSGPSPAPAAQSSPSVATAPSSVQLAGTVQSYVLRIVTVHPSEPAGALARTHDPSYAVIISPDTQILGHCSISTALVPRMPVTLSVPSGGGGALIASALSEASCL